MNLPNSLTVLRLILAGCFVVSLSADFPWHYTVALTFFLLASLTDYLDGVIARRYNLITDFGKLMDPLADKILMASAFICLLVLLPKGMLPAWAVIAIISREFLITGLRLLASSKGTVLPAEKLGKHKTLWQMIAAIYLLIYLGVSEWMPRLSESAAHGWQTGGQLLTLLAVLLTIYSGAAYFWKHRDLLNDC